MWFAKRRSKQALTRILKEKKLIQLDLPIDLLHQQDDEKGEMMQEGKQQEA